MSMFLSPVPDAYFSMSRNMHLEQARETFREKSFLKFGNKMAIANVEKYASGTGERNIDINRSEIPFKIINLIYFISVTIYFSVLKFCFFSNL